MKDEANTYSSEEESSKQTALRTRYIHENDELQLKSPTLHKVKTPIVKFSTTWSGAMTFWKETNQRLDNTRRWSQIQAAWEKNATELSTLLELNNSQLFPFSTKDKIIRIVAIHKPRPYRFDQSQHLSADYLLPSEDS